MTDSESSGATAEQIIDNYSIEMTAKDMESLREARNAIPKKTAISVTFLPGEDMPARVAAATLVKSFGFTPVPHISARRLQSHEDLTTFLSRLQLEVGVERAFVVAGDPPKALGPFEDALAVIRTGELAEIAMLCAESHAVTLIGLIETTSAPSVGKLPLVSDLAALAEPDALLITDQRTPQQTYDRIVAVLARERVLAPRLLNISRTPPRLAE